MPPDRAPAGFAAGRYFSPSFCAFRVRFATHFLVPHNQVNLIMNHSPGKIKYIFTEHIFRFQEISHFLSKFCRIIQKSLPQSVPGLGLV